MLHLFRFTCNDLCTWLPMTAPPLYYWYCTFRDWRAASTPFTKGPSDTFSSFSNHLFLHASDVCSCLRLKRGACTLLRNFHKTPPLLVLYQRVQILHILKCIPLTNSAIFLLHLSFSSTRLERRGLDSPTIMAE